jgi:hypothetical protein|tara:strand:+ start:884 stop:1468 length:585 start_codon:yes stop_codon:yes gene_type:complete
MNKPKSISNINICIIILILLSIIFIIKLISTPSVETFNSNVGSNFQTLIDGSMDQRDGRAKQEAILKSVDHSVEKSAENRANLSFENANTNSELMNKYIQDLMISDVGNPNRILVEDTHNELPSVIEDNLPQYNHEMRKLQNSKQVKQKYVIGVLKHKIDTLLNTLKPIENIKDEFEALKLPENADKVKVLKTV